MASPERKPPQVEPLRRGIDDLEQARAHVERVAAEATREEPKAWHAVLRPTGLTPEGAKGRVLRSFADPREAEAYRDTHHGTFVHPDPQAERPARGRELTVTAAQLEALEREDGGQGLARRLRQLRWEQEQGRYHNAGLWHDRDESPRVGQLVHYSPGIDYRGEPVPRRVTPTRPVDPGAPGEPQHVVFEMSRRTPGLGRVVALPETEEEAEAEVRRFDQKRLALAKERLAERWDRFEAGPELQALAGPRGPLRIRPHRHGRASADVIERPDEHGNPRLMVILSRERREADGRVRTTNTVLRMEDLKAVQAALEQKLARKQELAPVPPAPQPRVEPPDPGPQREPEPHRMRRGMSR